MFYPSTKEYLIIACRETFTKISGTQGQFKFIRTTYYSSCETVFGEVQIWMGSSYTINISRGNSVKERRQRHQQGKEKKPN